MSDPENFVARWSRLKRAMVRQQLEAVSAKAAPKTADAMPAGASGPEAHDGPPRRDEPSEPAFDAESLPPIESITAESDIKAFLQAGVPEDLTRAALRRAWAADPAIRDFIGLAENQWDFTDPTAMPGFGPLEATDDVRLLVSQAMGRLNELAEVPDPRASVVVRDDTQALDAAAAPSSTLNSVQTDGIMKENTSHQREESQHNSAVAATQHVEPEEKGRKARNRGTHGGALPK